MDFAASSDLTLRIAFWSGVAASALSFLLLFLIVLMRIITSYRERRKLRLLVLWRPLMVQSLAGSAQHYPAVPRADVAVFLNLWNHFQESLRGEAKDKLSQLAREVSIDKMAFNMLRHRRLEDQLLAIMTLGHLRKKSAWHPLSLLLKSDNPVASLASARALMQIDASAAVVLLMPLLVERMDWSPARVASILKEAGASVITEPLSVLVRHTDPMYLSRLIPFLELIYADESACLVREILGRNNDPQVIAACLRAMSDSRDMELVRKNLRHPAWPVRVQAAAAIGRMGSDSDRGSLVLMLQDTQWWVRYRAAQALSQLPLVTAAEMQQMLTEQTDRYAKDMLKQVIAERWP